MTTSTTPRVFGIEYINEALVNLCDKYRDPNTDSYRIEELRYLGDYILDAVLNYTPPPSEMFASYHDDLLKSSRYIIIEELQKDFHIPRPIAIACVDGLIQQTNQVLVDYIIDKQEIAKWIRYPDCVYLLLYR